MQYSLKYATLLLVAFSLALASSSWFPPIGSGLTLILLIVGLRLIFQPVWLGPTVWGALLGAVAFVAICYAGGSLSGEIQPNRYATSDRWRSVARRYAIPIGGIAGGILGHALHVRSERSKRESENASNRPSDDSHAA